MISFTKILTSASNLFKTAFYMKSHIRLDYTFLKFETKLEGNLEVNLIDLNAGKRFLADFSSREGNLYL